VIIRRRHTKNFTVIGNALFDDERLQADEVGILAFLLSRPNDWEVRRPALMRRWGYGEKAIKRVLFSLIGAGWCIARKTRLSNGTFNIIYEVRDEPGPPLSEEEIRRTLSLESSEAATVESEEDGNLDQPPVRAGPPPRQRGVDDQGVVEGGVVCNKDHLLNTDSKNTESTQATWSNFRKTWPPEHIISAFACENSFAELTDENREAAFRGIEPYLAECRSRQRKVCDLATYLRERRWERVPASIKAWPIKGGTPGAFRWLEYHKAMGQPTGFMEECFATGKLWYAKSEWPPAIPPKSTGPPPAPSLATEHDLDDLARESRR